MRPTRARPHSSPRIFFASRWTYRATAQQPSQYVAVEERPNPGGGAESLGLFSAATNTVNQMDSSGVRGLLSICYTAMCHHAVPMSPSPRLAVRWCRRSVRRASAARTTGQIVAPPTARTGGRTDGRLCGWLAAAQMSRCPGGSRDGRAGGTCIGWLCQCLWVPLQIPVNIGVLSCPALPCPAFPCAVMSCAVLSCPAPPCLALIALCCLALHRLALH